jgi:hypothetical protein
MPDRQTPDGGGTYNPIEFIHLTPLTKDAIKREALRVLDAQTAALKVAHLARNAGNVAGTLEPEMKAVAGSVAFIARDFAHLLAEVFILASKVLENGSTLGSLGLSSTKNSDRAR